MTTPAGWHPDPSGHHELRFWDGQGWTPHVANKGVQSVDHTPPKPTDIGAAPVRAETGPGHGVGGNPFDADAASSAQQQSIARQVSGDGYRGAGIANPGAGGGGLFNEPVLVVNQKAKLIELTNQYAVFNAQGAQVASVNQVGQSKAKKVLRALTSFDQFLTHHFEISDMTGQVLLRVTRPAKLVKSTVIIANSADQEIGRIVQENAIGKIHFALESGGQRYGSIRAENWRAWDFRIEDHTGAEIARIKKTWEGLAKTLFTSADNYVLQIARQLEDPLRTLVVASALTVDTALKQDSRGFN